VASRGDPIGIGFIGSGFAADLHAHALAPLRGHRVELVAVSSRSREHAEAFARRFEIPHVYADHRALLDAVRECREPFSGALLARETVEVIYAAYVSAAEGRRIDLPR